MRGASTGCLKTSGSELIGFQGSAIGGEHLSILLKTRFLRFVGYEVDGGTGGK